MLIRDLPQSIGKEVELCGWVDTTRLQRKMQFIVLRDHTGQAQLVNARAAGEPAELDDQLDALKPESAVIVAGLVREMPQVKLGGLEVVVHGIEVVNPSEQPLPVDEDSSVDRRSDYRFLDLRRPGARLIFEVLTTVEDAMRARARQDRFLEVHSPKLMATPSEGGAEVFRVDYFGSNAYLAQSPQFYKQMAIAAGLDRVFEVGPVFRAEPSYTTRHATEFTGVDVEMAWVDTEEDVMVELELVVAAAMEAVADAHGDQIAQHFGVAVEVPSLPFPRIDLAEARDRITQAGWSPALEGRLDLDTQGERMVSDYIRRSTGHAFSYVTRYPFAVRPFYHMCYEEERDITRSFDLVLNGIEIATGAQREHRISVLLEQAKAKCVDTSAMAYYIDCFRYGCPPHGGFGLGLNRFVMAMLGLQSLREATFLFRSPNRLVP